MSRLVSVDDLVVISVPPGRAAAVGVGRGSGATLASLVSATVAYRKPIFIVGYSILSFFLL